MVCNINIWHQRMTHVNTDGIIYMVRNSVVEGVTLNKSSISKCKACVLCKITRAPIPKQARTHATQLLQLVHTDVCGQFPVFSMGGYRCFVSFVCASSRYSWIYHIKSKTVGFDRFKQWLCTAENRHDPKLKVLKPEAALQSDNGGK